MRPSLSKPARPCYNAPNLTLRGMRNGQAGGYRAHRSGGHGAEPGAEHQRSWLPRRRLQPHHLQSDPFPGKRSARYGHHRRLHANRLHRQLETPPQTHLDDPGGRRRRREHRPAAAFARRRRYHHRRRQFQLQRHHPPNARGGSGGQTLHRRGHQRRRRGRALRSVDHARRLQNSLGIRQTHTAVGGRQSPGWRAMLRLGRRRRRRSLRQDGAQRHRIRRYAADLRSLSFAVGRSGYGRERDQRSVPALEQRQARVLLDRNHGQYPGIRR